MTAIPLDKLHFGHESDPPMNARLSGRETEINALAASIQSHGLIQALTVSELEGKFFVVDGNRRLAAYRSLAKNGIILADHEIRCDLAGGSGIEVSLAANIMRVPMHDADTYQTFRDLSVSGLSEVDIAARFGIDRKRVRRMLTLGGLSPVIVNAWRAGKLDAEAVRAFTVAKDLESQERVFAELGGRAGLRAHTIRIALGVNQNLHKETEFVGLDDYRAAGGHVVEDLFGTQHNVEDGDLMRSLYEAKVDGIVAGLLEEGWSWAARAETLVDAWRWNWPKLPPEEMVPTKDEGIRLRKLQKAIDKADPDTDADELPEEAEHAALLETIRFRGYTDEIKAKSGAVVEVDYHGVVAIKFGVVKPQPAAKAKATAAGAGTDSAEGVENEPADISRALKERLSEQLTSAAQQASLSNPNISLAALIASITTDDHPGQPISVAFNHRIPKRGEEKFAEVFADCCAMRDVDLMAALAAALAPYIDMRLSWGNRQPIETLIDALDQAPLREISPLAKALKEHFDADDYFKSAPKSVILTAIREAVSDAEANRLANAKKKDLAIYATANVIGTGWLPPELRTPSYAISYAGESRAA